MAMSTIGSSVAATNNQQSAEININSQSIEKNITNQENALESSSVPIETVSTCSTQKIGYINDSKNIPASTAVNYSKSNLSNIQTSNQNLTKMMAAAGENYTNMKGIWIKAEDATNISVAILKNANVTDIFIKTNLIKAPTYQTLLPNILAKFENSGIRIHAWITCFYSNGKWINPANTTQRSYLLSKIKDILSYNISGIHLDYIRYSGVGNNAAYNNVNATNTITSFVRDVKQLILSKKPKLALSAAVMPEGSSNAYLYGQDYKQLARYLDFIVPMLYKGNYGKNTSWIGYSTKYIVDRAFNSYGQKVPVIAGLQTYVSDYDVTLLTADDLYKDIKSAIDNGASGYVLFRYGMIAPEFLKPPSFKLNEIMDAASRVKSYIETNKQLPSCVRVGTTQVKISDFLKLMTTSVIKINSGITTPIQLKNVLAPKNSTGYFTSGSISKLAYLDTARKINSFINIYSLAPNYATTTLGKIQYESLIYMYSKILNFKRVNGYLPYYVKMNSTYKIAPPINNDLALNTFTLNQIMDAAKRVKSFIETNRALPSYVTIGYEQVKMTDFLRLLSIATIELNDGSWAKISLRSVNPSTEPVEKITTGNITKSSYIDIAKRIKSYIYTSGMIPNYVITPLGQMKFESLIYMYSKILSFYKVNNLLPQYVTMKAWSIVTKPVIVPAGLQQYLAATANCQVYNSQIQALAKSITAGVTNPYDKAWRIFNWVRDSLSYSFYYDTKYGAVGALNARTGNCVDTTHLLVALERAAGIPARYEHVYAQFSSGNWYGHVVAQVWVNGIWYIADATSARNDFGTINNWNRATATLYGFYASLPF